MDYSDAVERARNALAIAQPVSGNVDWYIDEQGEINAIHQTEPVTVEERLSVIICALAGDVLEMEGNLRMIPVTERLPHYNERVLIWDTWTKNSYIARRVESGWIGDNPRMGDLDVSHWRPLPVPLRTKD